MISVKNSCLLIDEIDKALIQNYRRVVNNHQEFNQQVKAMKEIM